MNFQSNLTTGLVSVFYVSCALLMLSHNFRTGRSGFTKGFATLHANSFLIIYLLKSKFAWTGSLPRKKNFLLGIAQIGGTPLPKLILTLFDKWKSCPNLCAGRNPLCPNWFWHLLKVEKLPKSLARGRAGNLGNTQKKGWIFWEGFPN